MPHRPAPRPAEGNSDDMRDYITEKRITPKEFQALYKIDHGFDLTNKQKEAIGIPIRFKAKSRPGAYTIFGNEPDAIRVDVVRGKKEKLQGIYTKDKKGHYHRIGKNGQFEHMTRKDRKGLGLIKRKAKVKKVRPAQPKKVPSKEGEE